MMNAQDSAGQVEELKEQLQKISEFVNAGGTGDIPDLSPEAVSCLYASAYEFYVNGKFETARHFFHILTVIEPYAKRNWMGLGATFQAEKNYMSALEAYSIAATLDLDDPYISFHAAECFFFLDYVEKGFEALDAAAAIAAEHKHHPLNVHIDLMRKGWQNYLVKKGN